ncbi:hypothetical protein ATANTOWER_017116 [Ataeniobius toweri]|uniref:Uncharacterized protein n=1 Tax=Ataeniobius toweri TaxID=208326 RepID=A0ABU7CF13_9TELE|nr:hypothetical protein [Ataeniobius toweri]
MDNVETHTTNNLAITQAKPMDAQGENENRRQKDNRTFMQPFASEDGLKLMFPIHVQAAADQRFDLCAPDAPRLSCAPFRAPGAPERRTDSTQMEVRTQHVTDLPRIHRSTHSF